MLTYMKKDRGSLVIIKPSLFVAPTNTFALLVQDCDCSALELNLNMNARSVDKFHRCLVFLLLTTSHNITSSLNISVGRFVWFVPASVK